MGGFERTIGCDGARHASKRDVEGVEEDQGSRHRVRDQSVCSGTISWYQFAVVEERARGTSQRCIYQISKDSNEVVGLCVCAVRFDKSGALVQGEHWKIADQNPR